jgi:predicted O-methyltransferase YrrM
MSYTGFTPMMVQYCQYISNLTTAEDRDGVIILEIGVDKGQTAYPLIQNLTQKNIKFRWVGVDIRLDKSFAQAVHVMSGVDHHYVSNTDSKSFVHYNVNDSRKFLKNDKSVYDLVLIDADHNYDTVSEELSHLNRITHPGSLVIMDDYGGKLLNRDTWFHVKDSHKDLEHAAHDLDTSVNKGGVTRAVDEFVEKNEGMWVKHVIKDMEDCCILIRSLTIEIENEKIRPTIYEDHEGRLIKLDPGSDPEMLSTLRPAHHPVTNKTYKCIFSMEDK